MNSRDIAQICHMVSKHILAIEHKIFYTNKYIQWNKIDGS